MPAKIANEINEMVKDKLNTIVGSGLKLSIWIIMFNIMFKDEVDDAFDVDIPVQRNNSVRDYQYFSYTAQDPNIRSRIELRFDDTSKYFLPCDAFIEVEGQLTQPNGNAYPNLDTTAIGFVNNGIIGTTKIESIDDNIDVASIIIGLARYTHDFIKSAGH